MDILLFCYLGLSHSNSENSLNSTRITDPKSHRILRTTNLNRAKQEQNDHVNKHKSNSAISSVQPTPERKLSINSTTSTGSTDRKSSIGDISSLGELLKKKKKEARRAEIVAAVTKRLYNARKKVELKPEAVEVLPEQEDKPENEDDDEELEELKLCSRARMRLQELSKKALFAHRGKMKRSIDVEAQTDFDRHVLRVKEVAVSTDEAYQPPSMLFLNRNILLTNCAYPSMSQSIPWSTMSVRKHSTLLNEDSFSDDSLDSNHELNTTEDKPSIWNVISISSGKQFKVNGNDDANNKKCKNISTQTIFPNNNETTKNEIEDFSLSLHGTDNSEHDNNSEHTKTDVESSDQSEFQLPVNLCNCSESSENSTCCKYSLKNMDRQLYTITENSEISDLSSTEFENASNMMMNEKCEHFHNIDELEMCKFAENNHKSSQTCIHDISFSNVSSCSMVCTADMFCENHNPEIHQHKEKTTQTTIRKCAVDNADKGGINKTEMYCKIPNESYRKICKKCGKFQAEGKELMEDVKTVTKSVQCALNNMPTNISTQTNNSLSLLCSTLLGVCPQLLQIVNPSLQSEDCIGILFNGQSSQPMIMKPIHWTREKQYDSTGIQTDTQEIQYSFDTPIYDSRIKCSRRKTKKCHKSDGQSTSQQAKAMPPDNKRLHTEENTHSWSTEDFSDEEGVSLLPRSTVAPAQGMEASGYQHWTEIKNLILGRDGNLFPSNIIIADNSLPVQHSKNVKKKSVSWSDLSGCGALQTEIVFTSDHNLYDSSQAPQNKINKSSLLDIITTGPVGSHRQR